MYPRLASKEKEYGLRRSDLSIPSPTRLMRKFGFMVHFFRSCGATAILAQWRNYGTALADTTLVRALYCPGQPDPARWAFRRPTVGHAGSPGEPAVGGAHARGRLDGHLLLQPCDRPLGRRTSRRHPLLGLRGAWHHRSRLVPARDALGLSTRAALQRANRPSIPPRGTSAGAAGDVPGWSAVYGAYESRHPPS